MQHNVGGEDEDSDEDSAPRIGLASDSEETEDEREGREGREAAIDGAKQQGEQQQPTIPPTNGDQPTGAAAPGPQTGTKPSNKREGGNDYDYCDDFIDDTEFIDMLEYTDRRKLKYEGFRIYRGRLDRVDELVKGAQPDKPTRKRKGEASGSDAERVRKAGEGGGDGTTGEPIAKKQKKKADKGALFGASPGGLAGGTPLSPPRKPIPPYHMPADVAAAIQELRSLAAAAPAPPPPDPSEPKGGRKLLPAPILDYIKTVQHSQDLLLRS